MERITVIKSEDFANSDGAINDLQQAIFREYPRLNKGLKPNLILLSPGMMYSLHIHHMQVRNVFSIPVTQVYGVKFIETSDLEHKHFEVY